MEEQNQRFKEYYETLTQNALKGETYLIKLKDDPNIYVGIPMLRSNLSREDDESFMLEIFEPVEKKGVVNRLISDIELLKPR